MESAKVIPYWMLLKRTYSGGMRQRKRSKWQDNEPSPKYGFHSASPRIPANCYVGDDGVGGSVFNPALRTITCNPEVETPKVSTRDMLGTGEFRYWGGTRYFGTASTMGFCRCCGEVRSSREARDAHKKTDCRWILEGAFKLFKRDKSCLICNKETHRKKWGIALCCNECQDDWMYKTQTPAALQTAMDLVVEESDKRGQ